MYCSFYQGETDTDVGGAAKADAARAAGYNCTFRAMIRDWRAKFHKVRPYILVTKTSLSPPPATSHSSFSKLS
eukprot:COSAG05_NODE_4064_length_1689_cov_3.911321_3_plen_72_part_01